MKLNYCMVLILSIFYKNYVSTTNTYYTQYTYILVIYYINGSSNLTQHFMMLFLYSWLNGINKINTIIFTLFVSKLNNNKMLCRQYTYNSLYSNNLGIKEGGFIFSLQIC